MTDAPLTDNTVSLLEKQFGALSQYGLERLREYGEVREQGGPHSLTSSYRTGVTRKSFPYATSVVDAALKKGSPLRGREVASVLADSLAAAVRKELVQTRHSHLPE